VGGRANHVLDSTEGCRVTEAPLHDLRDHLASQLNGSRLDGEVVRHRLRNGSSTTTLDTSGHMWPDADESARTAVGVVLAARADSLRTVSA
jgi:hypothetical protein